MQIDEKYHSRILNLPIAVSLKVYSFLTGGILIKQQQIHTHTRGNPSLWSQHIYDTNWRLFSLRGKSLIDILQPEAMVWSAKIKSLLRKSELIFYCGHSIPSLTPGSFPTSGQTAMDFSLGLCTGELINLLVSNVKLVAIVSEKSTGALYHFGQRFS